MEPYYQHNGITIYCGEALDILQTLPPLSIDAVIDDLPYGTTQCAWDVVIPFAPMWLQLARISKPRTPMVLFGTQPFTSLLIASNLKQFRYSLIWDKGRGFEPQLANIRPMKAHEDIAVFGIKSPAYNPQMEQLARPDKRNPKSGWPRPSRRPRPSDTKRVQLIDWTARVYRTLPAINSIVFASATNGTPT